MRPCDPARPYVHFRAKPLLYPLSYGGLLSRVSTDDKTVGNTTVESIPQISSGGAQLEQPDGFGVIGLGDLDPTIGTFEGIRTLRRQPVFAASIVLTLAVAIGMDAAIVSVLNAVVPRPLGYPDADRLVWLGTARNDSEPGFVIGPDFVSCPILLSDDGVT